MMKRQWLFEPICDMELGRMWHGPVLRIFHSNYSSLEPLASQFDAVQVEKNADANVAHLCVIIL